MNSNSELLIRINPEKQRISLENCDDGVISYKEITQETFLDCIKSSLQTERTDSGFLPQNCFHIRIHSDESREYCLLHNSLTADFSYFGTEFPNFPLPRLVFSFCVSRNGKVSSCKLGVVEEKVLSMDTKMYTYPFSNVGGFNICLGNNVLPTYKKAQALATLPNFILSLPNNNDSFNANNNKLNLDYRSLLNHLKNKNTAYYYCDVLIENGKTIQDFIGR